MLLQIFLVNWRIWSYELPNSGHGHCKIGFAGHCCLYCRPSKDKNQAIRFVKELQEKTKILEQFPENGATPRDRVLKSNGYRFLVHKDYLIVYLYEKSENTAHIMAVGGRKHDYLCIMKKFL